MEAIRRYALICFARRRNASLLIIFYCEKQVLFSSKFFIQLDKIKRTHAKNFPFVFIVDLAICFCSG